MDVPERIIGSFGAQPWPRLVVLAGVHGNEPAGVLAARRVLATLEAGGPAFRGRLICLAGNVSALRLGARYVDVDLNRLWAPLLGRKLPQGLAPGAVELAERRALAAALDEALAVGRRPRGATVSVLDMHTTSSTSAPFVLFTDRLSNRSLARHLGVPMILGLEEELQGTVLEHLDSLGVTAVTVEGGKHDATSSVDRLEAMLWLALADVGCLPLGPPGGQRRWEALLADATRELPRLFEIRHRHVISDRDAFQMDPGHVNFENVVQGQRLATDRKGPVCASTDGRLFMPLYQPQGEDGYFLARPVRYLWLPLSSLLRRMGAARLLPRLPGVEQDPAQPGMLVLNTRVARLLPLQLLHLLGYRKVRWAGGRLMAVQRPHDSPATRPDPDAGSRAG